MARSFRIFRMWRGATPAILSRLYGESPALADAPYDLQMRRFYEQKSSFTDYFTRHMAALGHEVMEVIFDHEPAQRAWARENDVAWNEETWQRDIPLAQMGVFRPDILNLHSLVAIPAGIGLEAKKRYPYIRKVVAFVGSRIYEHQFPGVDVILTGVPPLAAQYRARGIETHLLYHAFDRSVISALGQRKPGDGGARYPFTFIGTSGFAYHDSFAKRYWLLIDMMTRTDLEAWVSDGEDLMPATHAMDWSIFEKMRPVLIRQAMDRQSSDLLKVYIAKLIASFPMSDEVMEEYRKFVVPGGSDQSPFLPLIPLTRVIPERCHSPVFGLDFFDLLSRSDITLNVEADINGGSSANMRMFEATGVGACLLTEKTPNISELFDPDREVVTYSSTEECIEKVRFLSNNPQIRRDIAAAGQIRTLRDHTHEQRCVEIDSLFQRFVQ